MSTLNKYAERFDNIALERRDGILQMRLHTRGGPLLWGFKDASSVHAQLGDAFYEIGRDRDNKVVILTGTGDSFMTGVDEQQGLSGPMSPEIWDRLMKEGKDLLMNLLDIEAPMISAVNGPVLLHPELPTLSDIVLAAEHAEFADLLHFPWGGTVPGDGAHVWWPLVLGPNRGRAFLLMGQRISAREALSLGLVAEVLPAPQLLERAWAIARELIAKSPLALRHARNVLVQDLKRRLLNDLGYGLGVEGLAILSQK